MVFLRRHLLLPLLALLLTGCASQIFHPAQRQWQGTPADLGYDYINQFITADDGVLLNLWLLPATQERRGAVLYFHGNARNISSHLTQVMWLVDAGYDVVMADYRGFGASEGELALGKTTQDMQRIMHWFVDLYAAENKWLLGQSLGASLSAYVAGRDEQLAQAFNGVMLDSGFATFRAIGQDVLKHHWLTWPLQVPLSWLMPHRYSAQPQIANIAPTPLLILHSKQDYVVPYYHGERLYQVAREPKTLLTYQGRHIRGFDQEAVREQVLAFMRSSAAVK